MMGINDKINKAKYQIQLDKKTIEDNYNKFLSSQQNFKKIENNRSVKNSDKITINLLTKNESVPDFLKSQKNLPIITDSEYQILPELSKKIIQKKLKVGDKIVLDFDKSTVINSSEAKEAEFDIEILSIEEPIPFKITNDYLEKTKFPLVVFKSISIKADSPHLTRVDLIPVLQSNQIELMRRKQ